MSKKLPKHEDIKISYRLEDNNFFSDLALYMSGTLFCCLSLTIISLFVMWVLS